MSDYSQVRDDAEAALARQAELGDINDVLGRIAERAAEVSVALLSLVPFATRDTRMYSFVSDAMTGCKAQLDDVLLAQKALQALARHEANELRRLQEAVGLVDEDGIGGPGWSVDV